MLFRAIALSLALLIGGATIIPLATEFAEAGSRKPRKKKKRYWRGVKKYSKRWWQLYRAQERRKKLRAKKRRALRLRQLRLAQANSNNGVRAESKTASAGRTPDRAPQSVLPSGDPAPSGWRPATVSPSEIQFRVDNSQGDQVGSASISVVGPAAMPGENNHRKSVGGVATTALRRDVIDRMIRENGWVVNDYQKEVGGQSVYVVVAQSQARNGQVQSRMFYFTEVDGKIYSVATNSPMQEAERLADESEKVINSLKSRVRPTQRASN
ncbi:MAG: hypothetical protein AB7J13_13940 [Pyrinomonadaceae bacterium]|jgi:hypothetical protein